MERYQSLSLKCDSFKLIGKCFRNFVGWTTFKLLKVLCSMLQPSKMVKSPSVSSYW